MCMILDISLAVMLLLERVEQLSDLRMIASDTSLYIFNPI